MGGDGSGDKFAHHARAVAIDLYGEPNKHLSSKTELRFGQHGSKSVDLERGIFYDHQEAQGGGVLWAIAQETGQAGAAAVEWMRQRGYDVADDRPPPMPRQQNSRLDPAGNWLPPAVPDGGKLTKVYDYTNGNGDLLYQVCRFDWPDPNNTKGHGKTFLQRRPDPSKRGGFTYQVKGAITPVPYRLPELIEDVAAGYPVFVVEGEAKVDALRALGVPATCNHGGAGKFPQDLVQHFDGADVILLPDNDEAGQAHMRLVASRLEGVARRIRSLTLPNLPPKGDVVDFLQSGGTAERLYDLVDEMSRPAEAAKFVSRFNAVAWDDLDAPGAQHEYLVKDVLTRGELTMMAGASQSGKSFLAVDIALAVARGVEWSGHKVRRGGVIYQAGEGAAGLRRKRLPAYRIGHDVTDRNLPFVLMPCPLDLHGSDDPTDAFIEECLHFKRMFGSHGLELIVIDTLARAAIGADENSGKDMGQIIARCERIREATGACVMLVHHMNADGTKARGHTSTMAAVDSAIYVQKLLDQHDAKERPVRSWRLSKAKDGEDGKETKFVLKGIRIGEDEDGEAVFSCIVAPPLARSGEEAPSDEGTQITGSNAVMLRAVYDAIRTRGVVAPRELALGQGAQAVDRANLTAVVRSAFDADGPPTEIREGETVEAATARRDAALRQQVKRSRDYLYSKGVLGQRAGWTWLTGKRVRGFPTPPGLPDAERENRRRRQQQDDQPPPPEPDTPFTVRDEDFR